MNDTNNGSYVPSAAPGRPGGGSSRKAIVIATSVIGGVLLLGAVGAGVISGLASLAADQRGTQTVTAQLSDVRALDIDAGSANFTVVFDGEGGADAALLEVQRGTSEWRMKSSDAVLMVERERGFGLDWLRFGPRPEQNVVLHLPQNMRTQQLDADLTLSSGEFYIEGDLGEVDADLSSGTLTVSGTARSFDAEVSSGYLNFELTDVATADIDVSSGRVRGDLGGSALRSLELSVSSGNIDISVPDQRYSVSSRISSGNFDNLLRTDPSSSRTVDVSISSGNVTLRPGD